MTSNATNEPNWLNHCLFLFSSREQAPDPEEMRGFYDQANDFTYDINLATGMTYTYRLGNDEGMVCRFWNPIFAKPAMLRLVQFWFTRLPQPVTPQQAQALQELMQRPAIMVVLPAMSDPEGEPLARMLANALKALDAMWYAGGRLFNTEGDVLMTAPTQSHDPGLVIFQDLAHAAENYVPNPVAELTSTLVRASDAYPPKLSPKQTPDDQHPTEAEESTGGKASEPVSESQPSSNQE
jgi:hypothetical protein